MSRLHCPECGLDLDPTMDTGRCPHCGARLDAPQPTDLVIDVRARSEDSTPLDTEPRHARAEPVFEEQTYRGRLWPGGPEFLGRTFVFQSGGPMNPNQGRGCCGCGCLLLIVAAYVFIQGLRSIF